MLDSIDLSYAISKKAFKPVQDRMLERIVELSELVYEQKRPAIVVFEGWDAAGKGTTIRTLTAPLDARGFKVLSTQAARTHEKQKPWLWRFWMNIPRHGQIAIFDRSWYGRVLVERVEGLTPVPEWIAAYEEINQFERTLADDGTLFIKFWLHISREEQLRRFLALSQDPTTFWQVAAEDWEHHRKYDEYLAAVQDMLANTHTRCAPWTVIPATDREYRLYTVLRTLIERLEEGMALDRTHWPDPDELDAYNVQQLADKSAKKAAKAQKKAEHAAAAAAAGGKSKKQKSAGKAPAAAPSKKKKNAAADELIAHKKKKKNAVVDEPLASAPAVNGDGALAKGRRAKKNEKHKVAGPAQEVQDTKKKRKKDIAAETAPAPAPAAVVAVPTTPTAPEVRPELDLTLKKRGRPKRAKAADPLSTAAPEEA